MSGAIYEIRDYHFDPDRFDEYRAWSVDAVRVLGELIDVVGWWLDSGEEAMIMGSDPMELPHGQANVTWMIRWESMSQRSVVWESLWDEPTWKECWDRHPGFDGYRHMSVRFMEKVETD